MPNPIKPAGKRINRVTKSVGVVRSAGAAPRMPSGLCPQAKTAWAAYWSDTVSGVMRPSDASLVLVWAVLWQPQVAKALPTPTVQPPQAARGTE